MRSRLLLLAGVLVIVGAVWYASGQERRSLATGDAHTQSASEMLTAMLNQESGLRGYLLTGDTVCLAPYTFGRQQFERALVASAADPRDGAGERARLAAQTSAARAWQTAAENEIANSLPGHPNTSLPQQLKLKAMLDRFRATNDAIPRGRPPSATPAWRTRGPSWC